MNHLAEEPPLRVEVIDCTIDPETQTRAKKTIILLPEGWPEQHPKPIYAGSTESVKKLARSQSVPMEILHKESEPLACRENRSADWVAPTMFVSSMLLSENPTALSIALNVISNYVTDAFKGLKSDPKVQLQVLHNDTKTGKTTRVKYSGPASELKEVLKTINKLGDGK